MRFSDSPPGNEFVPHLFISLSLHVPHMKRIRNYSAAKIDDNTKTSIAKLYIIQKDKGKTRQEFTAEMAQAGLSFSERQLDRWVSLINLGLEAISPQKLAGASAALTREQKDISSGWVLDRIDHGEAVHLETFCAFVLDHFSLKIDRKTASNYLHEDGFSYRLLQKKSSSFVVDVVRLEALLWEWVYSKQNYLKSIPPSKLCSIDFTFTGHRTERRSGFGIEGAAQPMEAKPISKFTNCIVTVIWADGINRTPPILFTYNQNFRWDRNPTVRRAAQVEHLRERLAHYGINKVRVIYIGKDKGEKETYVKESPALLRRFFGVYGVPPGGVALSDNGNSFSENGESVLKAIGFENHENYPADIHQYLSANDNRCHGTSKGSWRSPGVNHSDDVDSCLMLLSLLDRDITKYGKYWFNKNILELKEEGVRELIGTRGPKKSHLHKSWLRAYRISIGHDARGERPNIPEELQDGLDGFWYWEEEK
jgi:transposase